MTNKFLKNARTGISLVCLALLTTACVSQNKYEAAQSKNDLLRKENNILAMQRSELYTATIALGQELEIRNEDIAILQEEQAELAIEMEVLIAAGTVKMELMKSGLKLTLDESVLFNSGSATIKPAGVDTIKALVAQLEELPYQIVVVGHTDNVPVGPNIVDRFPSNWSLAAARAAAVVKLMSDEGIQKQQLVAVSLGDTQPIASNDTAEGRAANRRIEVRLRPVVKE
ncbi:MAG: OmpA family protein [Gammaproteobacteria bacterium]|nr:OmpA family protein [Gammaproteobacteria bacterium]MCP4088926.1 OmpA family protein [Gammaproteobacteria bacterium]MCP4274942.1 OmpA family protein [Gammaproteobacteria bacterium]MCP4831991.1 OmpA family protein [Gammaproteobacteria bacterium]MCP4929426.1 OmpA family protein [Gammaproteobacteria bacterium]